MRKIFLAAWLTFTSIAAFAQKDYNIVNYGAKPGLSDNNAVHIQKAIDAAAADGGGKVIIPAGNYVTGPLLLKSMVELHFEDDAVLLGSTKRMDYSEGMMAIISAYGQHDISITGNGVIDGQGQEVVQNALLLLRAGKIQDDEYLTKRPTEKNRPNLMFFKKCKKVKVTQLTLKNAASWVQNYKECDDVVIDRMTVNSTAYWNNDGIDIVDSKNVRISNSFFNAADDAICLKSEIINGSCENVWVENCTARSSANGFKLGTGSIGGFKNITVKNLTVYDTYRSAVALETVDGAAIENVNINHVVAKNTGNAIFIRLGHRNNDARFSKVNNVIINDVKVEVPFGKPDIGYPLEGPLPKVLPHNLVPASVTGLAGHPVQNVKISNVEIVYGGGGNKEKAYVSVDSLDKVPENPAGYPEFNMFGELPAWGLYVRHAEEIMLTDFKITLQKEDFRPALVFDDVKGLKLKNIIIPTSAVLPAVVYKGVIRLATENLALPAGEAATLTK